MASPQMTVNIAGIVPLPTGGATAAKQDTQITAEQAILAKLLAAPATEAKQDTQITAEQAILAKLSSDPATQTTLAAVLAKLTSDPATQTTLAAILAKIIAAPATEASLALINAVLGTTAGAAVITDATGTAQQYLRGLVKLWISGLPTGTNAIGTVQPGNTQNTTPWLVSPLTFAVDVTLTRPSDTTTYAINDEVTDTGGAIRTITGAARASGGYVRLISASCVNSSAVAVRPQIAAFLFDTTSTPATDNAAFAPTDGVMAAFVGVLPFNVWYLGDDTAGATGNAVSPYLGPPLEMKTSGSANLFLRLKIYNAYVPVSAETFIFRLVFAQY